MKPPFYITPKKNKTEINNYKTKSEFLENNKNFCMAPWMHLHVINDGRAFPCCLTPIEDENSFGNVNDEKLIDIVNSKKAKSMRKNMLNGEGLPLSCERCVSKEANNLNSMRTGLNKDWFEEMKPLIDITEDDGYLPELQLKYWDFRFSNYCNLACTTCGPLFSTQWASDWEKINPDKGKYSETRLINLEKAFLFWEDIKNNLNYMKKIHFAGGEPLIMPEHWQILKLLDEKQKYDIELKYSTNATTLGREKDDVFNYWKKFKYVHLSLSIDGANEAYEYIRYKGNWEKTFQNLKRIRESGIVDYWFHPTVSILNIFRLTELHEILHNADLIQLKNDKNAFYNIENYWVAKFHINILYTPSYYSITVLPPILKEKVAEKIINYGKKFHLKTGVPTSGWENIVKFMYSENNSHLFYEFNEASKKLDKIRNNDVFKINPELKNF